MFDRKHSILCNSNLSFGKYLEIGPLHRPLIKKDEADVYYLDHCSTDDLINKYKLDPGVPRDAIVNVDIVVEGGDLLEKASHLSPFRGIVASHVIEHVPNLVKWLQDIWNLLEIDGVLYLAAPDKRFTFDIARRSSTIKDISEAYEENRWRPSLDTVCDSYRNSVGLESASIWNGSFDMDFAAVGWPSTTVKSFIEKHLRGEYVDVHCWIFTPWELISLLKKIVANYDLSFDIEYFKNTSYGEEEFHLQLIKRHSKSGLKSDWAAFEKDAFENSCWPCNSAQEKLLKIKEILI